MSTVKATADFADFSPAAKKYGVLKAIASQTSSGTKGTRSDHTHGLGRTPKVVFCQVTAADADGAFAADAAQSVHVVKFDATSVTVRANVASVPFTLYVG